MKTVFGILYGSLLVTLTSVALGWLLIRVLKVELRRVERVAVAFVSGAAVLSLVMYGLCAAHLVYRGVLQVFAVAAVAATLLSRARMWGRPRFSAPWWVAVPFLVYGAAYFVNALAPEVSPDGSSYHTEIIGAYQRAHGFGGVAPTIFSGFPQGSEMLYLFAYVFGRNSAAAMVHFSFLIAVPVLMIAFGRRFGIERAAAFGALLVFASPVVGIDGVSAYNDVALAAAAFAAFYVLQIWDEERRGGLLVMAGLLAGFCVAIKYTGAVAPVAAVGYVLVRGRSVVRASVVGSAAGLVAAPWFAKNWVETGNPFFPLFSAVFPNAYVDAGFDAALGELGRQAWKGWWGAFVTGAGGGVIGPMFLLAPAAVLAFNKPVARKLALAACVMVIPFVLNRDTRFAIPALAFAAMAMGMGIEAVSGRWRIPMAAVAGVHLVLSFYAVMPLYGAGAAWRITETPVRAALRIEPEKRFFERRLPDYSLARLIEERTPPGARVLAINAVPQGYTSRTVVVGFQSTQSLQMRDWLSRAVHSDGAVEECRWEFGRRRLRSVRLMQNSAEWSVDEIRFWSGEAEFERGSKWRIAADPNGWEVPLAFDGNPVTFWSRRDPRVGAAWVEADFGEPTELSGVTVRSGTWGQSRPRIEGSTEAGERVVVGENPVCQPVKMGRGLRRLTAMEWAHRGLRFILIRDSEQESRDLFYNRAQWGISEIGEQNGVRLYRID